MLTIPGNPRIFLYQDAVNMLKSFEGLSGIIEKAFPGELVSGAYFVFLNQTKDRMKVLYWDNDGFVIWYKRLEKGSFSRREHGAPLISRREFLMLLEGITPKRLNSRFSMK